MQKTTVYLPDDLKRALHGLAAERGQSEAELIREAIAQLTEANAPVPKLPLFRGSSPVAERVDEALAEGFGRE